MYFDPGTGSMIIQIIVAAVASIGALFVTFKVNLVNLFKGVRGNDEKVKEKK